MEVERRQVHQCIGDDDDDNGRLVLHFGEAPEQAETFTNVDGFKGLHPRPSVQLQQADI